MRYFCFILVLFLCLNIGEAKTILIKIQPCEDFKEEEINELLSKLKNSLEDCTIDNIKFDLLPKLNLNKISKIGNKYRAEEFIFSVPNYLTIILTHKDICLKNYKGKSNWGILGLAIIPKYKVCVVSDYRLKSKKRDYWKVITHEFFHAYYKASHCKYNNFNCIMMDAKGKANFKNKVKVCDKCKKEYNIIGK